MLRQDELASINAISIIELSPILLIELRKVITAKRKKTVVPARSSITTPGVRTISFQRSSVQLAGKRLANELATLGDSSKPAIGAQHRALTVHCIDISLYMKMPEGK